MPAIFCGVNSPVWPISSYQGNIKEHGWGREALTEPVLADDHLHVTNVGLWSRNPSVGVTGKGLFGDLGQADGAPGTQSCLEHRWSLPMSGHAPSWAWEVERRARAAGTLCTLCVHDTHAPATPSPPLPTYPDTLFTVTSFKLRTSRCSAYLAKRLISAP